MIAIDRIFVRSLFKPRKPSSSKWDHGHALLIAGSRGKAGAAILASKACLRSGVGLLTAHVPNCLEFPMLVSLPEAMMSFSGVEEFTEILLSEKVTAVGVGPGIGVSEKTKKAFFSLLETNSLPMVLDADALNLLASEPDGMSRVLPNSVLTPHYGEFSRLIHKNRSNEEEILDHAMEFAQHNSVVLVLKSSSTRIFTPHGTVYCTTTGNAGLAKGGSGDVLTGMITAFLAQGYSSLNAACLAVYLHGLAADITCEKIALESMIATDIIENISTALQSLKD